MKLKSSRSRRPGGASRNTDRKASAPRRTTPPRHQRVAAAGTATDANDDEHRHAVAGSEASPRNGAEAEQLIGQMRDANERLILAAGRAENLSDDARVEAGDARADLERLMRELQDAQQRLTAAARKAQAMAALAKRREREYQRLSIRLLHLQDEERKRFAIDLHDSTAQHLAALTMNLDVLEAADDLLDVRSRRALAQSRALADQCSREVRTMAYLLHPPLLDEAGLLPAVRWYIAGFIERSGVRVDFDAREVGRMPGLVETALFRVVQEGLTNVRRHASTSTASIRLTRRAAAVVLDIQDQGHGLRDHPTMPPGGAPLPEMLGVGIQGMRERIRQLGGTFDIEFTHTGTTIHVVVPLNAGTL
jgi:two-component system, NarL family, sensor kinase